MQIYFSDIRRNFFKNLSKASLKNFEKDIGVPIGNFSLFWAFFMSF